MPKKITRRPRRAKELFVSTVFRPKVVKDKKQYSRKGRNKNA